MKKNIIFLAADDDQDDQEFFRDAAIEITDGACAIVQLDNGIQVLDYLLGQGDYSDGAIILPDVIILDLNMPKLNGIESLREIKNNPPISQIPTYILTTSWDDTHMRHCKQLGASGFFTKPLQPQVLKNIIQQIITEVERGL